MLKNHHKGLTIWTLVANFFIVFAAGHGIGTIGLLQLVTIAEILGLNNFFSHEQVFRHPLFWVAMINFLGQLLVLVSLLQKQWLIPIRLLGIGLLLAAFILVVYYFKNQETLLVTVITGVPFLILSAVLMYKHFHRRQAIVEACEDCL